MLSLIRNTPLGKHLQQACNTPKRLPLKKLALVYCIISLHSNISMYPLSLKKMFEMTSDSGALNAEISNCNQIFTSYFV